MPENTCRVCGDGTTTGHELCASCDKRAETTWKPPEDNWRRSVRYPRSRYR